jgi:hypothetical protein
MFETILSKLGLPLLMEVVGGALGRINHPVAQGAAKAIADTQAALVSGLISPEAAAEANRHLEKMTEMQQQAARDALSEVNESLRAEVASSDPYVRRMRPTFGYLMAVTWTLQMIAISYVIVFDTQNASVVLDAISSLSAIWTVALSVLGIYVYKRSEEKTSVLPEVQKPTPPVPARKPRASFNT